MNLIQSEASQLFDLKKYPINRISIDFPLQGEEVEIELENDTKRIRFIADISNSNEIVKKATLQLRYKKIFILRRLDFNGNHKNPPGDAPDLILKGFENYTFKKEDHVHFYFEGFGERWALPLDQIPEVGIVEGDDLFEKMEKFFRYCNVESLNIRKVLEL